MTTPARTCSQCGAEVRDDAPLGLCPKCLLQQGAGSGASKSEAFQSPIEIPSYQILREISRGGQGVVYEGVQASTGRQVAIKVLQSNAPISPEERARFEREVRVLAGLNHPYIVTIFERGITKEGWRYLVMPYIPGHSLDEWLCSYYGKYPHGPPPDDPSELLRLFYKICDAVNAAHLRGVVHRDLKPSNIRIDEDGEPRILDFGLARLAMPTVLDTKHPAPVTLTGQFLGTPQWASPEQAEGHAANVDMRSDVYSLGVILYQMLTGKFPYPVDGSMVDVLNSIIRARPTPPSKVLSAKDSKAIRKRRRLRREKAALNSVIDAIVLKALAKRREDRYQSAGELGRDIANYLAGRPTIAGGERTEKRDLRIEHRLALALLGGCVAAVLLWIGISFVWEHKNRLVDRFRNRAGQQGNVPKPKPPRDDNEVKATSTNRANVLPTGSTTTGGLAGILPSPAPPSVVDTGTVPGTVTSPPVADAEPPGHPPPVAEVLDLPQVANDKRLWPKEVSLTEAVSCPVVIKGKEHGSTVLQAGKTMRLVAVLGEEIRVAKDDVEKVIPAKSTDLLARAQEMWEAKHGKETSDPALASNPVQPAPSPLPGSEGETPGQSPEQTSPLRPTTAPKPVGGNLYAKCDDFFVLYVNDSPSPLMTGEWPKPPGKRWSPLLRPGDTIKVKAVNYGGEKGFALIFVS